MRSDTSENAPSLMAGHIVRALQTIHGPLDSSASKALESLFNALQEGGSCIDASSLSAEELAALKTQPIVGAPGEFKPLILDGSRFYLHRYWKYECKVAAQIRSLLETPPPSSESAGRIENLLSDIHPDVKDIYRRILHSALESSLMILSGGPGTGKTTTVARIVALLHLIHPEIKLALAAPTGKAAARVKEATLAGLERLARELGVKVPLEQIAKNASTVHRLLGSKPSSVFFRHNEKNPVPFDLVIIDEVSMLELPLFSKLLSAVRVGRTRLILVGDAEQLPSVQAGNVLADLVSATGKNEILKKHFHVLKRNWRSGESPHVSALITAIRENKQREVQDLLESQPEGVKFIPLESTDDLENTIHDYSCELSKGIAASSTPTAFIHAMEQTRLLCPHRHGSWGCLEINRKIIVSLQEQGLLKGRQGLPIIINQNDYEVRLFNGDTGVLATENPHQEVMAWFEEEKGLRALAPGRLPPYEPAFALTIHRSQGSDYDEVFLILPLQESRLLNRQLLYTAVSRARKRVVIAGKMDLLLSAMDNCSRRASGLADRLSDSA